MLDDNLQPDVVMAERWELLQRLDRMMAAPLVILSFVWLALLVLEFAVGTDTRLEVLFYAIWVVFILEVAVQLIIAPDRVGYLRANWLKVAALTLPALRALRALTALKFLRAAGAVRSASLLRLVTSFNRGMGALSRTLDRAHFVYFIALTLLVMVLGSAGLLYFEAPPGAGQVPGTGISDYGEALWWTSMTMTTIGTDYSPVSIEGRVVAWLLALYAIGVFGYVTATIATHFLGVSEGDRTAAEEDDRLDAEVALLRAEIRALSAQLKQPEGTAG